MNEGTIDRQAQKPLRGVVLCGTSLEQHVRAHLGDLGSQMGATHSLDLTSAVTHLLVGDINTQKYKHVAKARPDVHVLKPGWIQAVRDIWVQSEEVDLGALTEEYRLPTLYGLNICITGFEDPQQRDAIMDICEAHGATYHRDLTKNVSHLIAAKPQGAKYDRARQWQVRVVSHKWLEQSLQRGMALDEALYDPVFPEQAQGRGAFLDEQQTTSLLGRRAREPSAPDAVLEDGARRTMRRTASSRLSNRSQNIWEDISRPERETRSRPTGPWMESAAIAGVDEGDNRSARSPTSNADSAHAQASDLQPLPADRSTEVPRQSLLFSEWICFAYGFSGRPRNILHKVILENGGVFAETIRDLEKALEEAAYETSRRVALIHPAFWMSWNASSLPSVPAAAAVVTENWVERSVFYREALEPEKDVLSRSFLHVQPDCFSGMRVHTTGFGDDVRYVNKIVSATGGVYVQDLGSTSSVLIYRGNVVDYTKPMYARERAIPVVTDDWFLDSVEAGKAKPFHDYDLPETKWADIKRKYKTAHSAEQNERSGHDKEPTKRPQDKPPAQRLSAVRKRGVTPALNLGRSAPVPTEPARKRQRIGKEQMQNSPARQDTAPFTEDTPSPPRSQALEELAPAMNSSHRPSQDRRTASPQKAMNLPEPLSALDGADGEGMKENEQSITESFTIPGDFDVGPLPEPEFDAAEDRERIMSDILARQRAGLSSGNRDSSPVTNARRRKDRKLGRAPSGNAGAISFTHPTRFEIADSVDTAASIISGDGSMGTREPPPLPSQQLTYDAPGAEEHRRLMSKKMGTMFEEEGGKRVSSIGVVKDADTGTSGVGGRVRGRHRER